MSNTKKQNQNGVTMSDNGNYTKDQLGNTREASPQMKLVIGVVSLVAALALLVVLADKAFTFSMLTISKAQTTARIESVKEATSKGTKSYWITYLFEVDTGKYSRTSLFGLLKKETKILSSDRSKYQVGSSIDVNYSRMLPQINEAINDPYRSDKNAFMIIGAILFGLLGVNSFRKKRTLE
jgi:hypothetical protein